MQNPKRHQLKALLEDEKFDALVNFYAEYLDKIRKMNVIGETSDETLKLTYMREGRILAIEEFFRQLEQEVQ